MSSPDGLVARQSELQAKTRALESERNAVVELERQFSEGIEQLAALVAQVNPHAQGCVELKEKVDKLEEEVAKLETAHVSALDRQKLAEAAAKVYGPAGVRAYILDTVTPFLNARTAYYLSLLTDGNIHAVWSTLDSTKKGEVRERFSIDVTSKVGAATFKGLSGGEKRKVRLACAMALQDLVASRATKPINLFIADEIDHALDESGLERLMAILDKKAQERGTVLVISHNSLADWIDQCVVVVKEGGVSRLEGSALE